MNRIFVIVVVAFALSMNAQAKNPVIRPGELWHDTAGHVINAHGGGVMFDRGVYWWYGEHKVYGKEGNRAHVGVHAYSSTNLLDWDDRGIALAVSSDPNSDITDGCVLERPKVLRCPKTGKYVMYFHLELKGQGYSASRTGLAVSDVPEGPFKFLRSFRPNAGSWPVNVRPEERLPEAMTASKELGNESGAPNDRVRSRIPYLGHIEGGQMSRDMTLFVDDDGKAYHIFSSEHNSTVHIAELTDDYLDYTGRWYRVAEKTWTEAPAVCKHNGYYWMIGSGCTGWSPNEARLFRAKNIQGPWELLGNPCRGVNPSSDLSADITWGGQSTYLLQVNGCPGKFIAMFDIWNPKNHEESRYIWLPVKFEGTRLWIDWISEWKPFANASVPTEPMRFMTFNIWGDYFKNQVEEREQGVLASILKEKPAIVSLQEVTPNWYASKLFAGLRKAGYETIRGDEWMALYRAGAGKEEIDVMSCKPKKTDWVNHEPLVYDKRRLACLDNGCEFFSLAMHPNKSMTWAVMEDRASGIRFITFATHFWWKQNGVESDSLRELNARKVIETIDLVKAKWGDLPVIGGGDLNCKTIGEPALRTFFTHGYLDAAQSADVCDPRPSEHRDPVRGVDGKYHGKPGEDGVPGCAYLDHVVYSAGRIHAMTHRVVIDQEALDVSDHSPVVVDFILK